jgi:hypothetical protein
MKNRPQLGALLATIPDDGLREYLIQAANDYADGKAPLKNAAEDLWAAVAHVLIASEDNGDMNDIDWGMLRSALAKAKPSLIVPPSETNA